MIKKISTSCTRETEEAFPMSEALRGIDWNFENSDKSAGIHAIHPYPAKFIAEIPRALIKTIGLPSGTWVLDPFCGSGVALVESQIAGFPAVGIDINPIACLISRVKTGALPEHMMIVGREIAKRARMSRRNPKIPRIPNLDHWFRTDVQEEVAKILEQIDGVESAEAQDVLKLALSSILVRVSNQESDTRYAAVEKNLSREDVHTLFLAAVERICNAKNGYVRGTHGAIIIEEDILQVRKEHITQPIGLVITSPPYPNAYEYWLYHKYRMFWLGYDPLKVKSQEIGARAHYFKKNHPTEEDFRAQMKHLLDLLWDVVVKNGHVCIIIGRSKIHGRIIDNGAIIQEKAEEIGFRLVAALSRTISPSRKCFNLAHANIKKESLLVFRK